MATANWSDNSYAFSLDGRSQEDLGKMKEHGYVESDNFAEEAIRDDGYFCGSCKWFDRQPNSIEGRSTTHDGFCRRYQFQDRDYGCCGGWQPQAVPKMGGTLRKVVEGGQE